MPQAESPEVTPGEVVSQARAKWPESSELAIRIWHHEYCESFFQLVAIVPIEVDWTGWQILKSAPALAALSEQIERSE